MTQLALFVALAVVCATKGEPITEEQVQAAQNEWVNGMLNIATKHRSESADYIRALADQFVDKFYAYTISPNSVFLRIPAPSDSAANSSFCLTRECAIAHILSLSVNQSWSAARFENGGFVLQGDMAMAMGHCIYTGSDFAEMKFTYSFGYVRDDAGNVRISLLHFSRPSNTTAGDGGALSAAGNDDSKKAAGNMSDATAASEQLADGKVEIEKSVTSADSSDAATAPTTTTTTTTTTATTTTVAAATTTTNDWFYDGRGVDKNHLHHHHHHAGRPTKAPTEANGGSIIGSFVKVLVVVLLLFSLALVAFTAQVKSRPGMSPSDKVAAGADIFQRKVQTMVTGKSTLLPSSYDKHV